MAVTPWEEAEKLQRDMGKRILGLMGSTNNEVIQGELGWWTMKARRDMLRLRYWWKILNMGRERLTRRVYEWDLRCSGEKRWTAQTRKLLIELGLGREWERQEVNGSREEWGVILNQKIQEREQQKWWRSVTLRLKLRTYRKVKKYLRFEEYLKSQDEKGRRAMARLRSGTNELRIETGRYDKEEI